MLIKRHKADEKNKTTSNRKSSPRYFYNQTQKKTSFLFLSSAPPTVILNILLSGTSELAMLSESFDNKKSYEKHYLFYVNVLLVFSILL